VQAERLRDLQRGSAAAGFDVRVRPAARTYSLAATSIAIFTFMLNFLYPRFASGEVNAVPKT
jgi:hypothetical protein